MNRGGAQGGWAPNSPSFWGGRKRFYLLPCKINRPLTAFAAAGMNGHGFLRPQLSVAPF
jgi:hypothetical protein